MTTLLDYLPNTFSALSEQLESDQSRWGDTWKKRPIEDQELRFITRMVDYFDQYVNAGTPIPWLKVMGEAHICYTRETHPDYGESNDNS